MCNDILLAVWSAVGLIWWLMAWRLTAGAADEAPPLGAARGRTLSIFKPLPRLGPNGLEALAGGLESFLAQLDAESELLLGIHECDREVTAPFLKRLRALYPAARLKIVFRSEPDGVANPKIAWQKVLAREAEGELWLWSDADIVIVSGFLQSARLEYEQCARTGARMVTFPYVVREINSPPSLLQTLFVNVEFYPGVLLLRSLGPVDFGLGAAMLFRRDDFLREVDWNELGSRLADDFFLGQALRPVRIGQTAVATVPGSPPGRMRWPMTSGGPGRSGGTGRSVLLRGLSSCLCSAGWWPWRCSRPMFSRGWDYWAWFKLKSFLQWRFVAGPVVACMEGT